MSKIVEQLQQWAFGLRWRYGFAGQKRRWRDTNDVDEVGTLVAEWLTGDTEFLPWSISPTPDPETHEEPGLIDLLAALNRTGYVTLASQPAQDGTVQQRAAVEMLLDNDRCQAVVDAMRDAGLGIHVTRKRNDGADYRDAVPVTVQGDRVLTTFGGLETAELENMFEPCSPALIDTLTGLARVVVLDPEWGRTSPLWDALRPLASAPAWR